MTTKEVCINCNYKYKKQDKNNFRCPACCTIRDKYSNIAKATGLSRAKVKTQLIAVENNITHKE